MATDIAQLGFEIASGPVAHAAADLDRMAAAGKRAEDAANRMGPRVTEAAEKARRAAGGLSVQSADAADKLRKMAQAASTLDGPLGGIASRIRSLGALIHETSLGLALLATAAGAAVVALVRYGVGFVDTWSDINSRVGLAIGSMDASAVVLDRLATVARRTYSALETTAESFVRNSTTLRELGKSTAQQLDFTEALNLALVVSGAKADRARMLQEALGRAMAGGALRGQELNSVVEQGGRVAEAIAEELGVGVNQLRALGNQGKITSEIVYNALTKRLMQFREEAEKMPATLGDGFMLIRNSFLRLTGTFDQQNKLSESVATGFVAVADSLQVLARTAVVAASSIALVYSGAVISGVYALSRAILVGAVGAMRALTIAIAANPIGALAVVIGTVISVLWQFSDSMVSIGGRTIHLGNTLEAVWTTVTESVNIAITAISTLRDWIWNWLGMEAWSSMAKSALSAIADSATNLATSIWGFIKRNWSAAAEIAESGAARLKQYMSELDADTKKAADSIVASVTNIGKAWNAIDVTRLGFAANMPADVAILPSHPNTPKTPTTPAAEQKNLEKLIAQMRERSLEYQHETNVIGMSTFASERYLNMQRLVQAAIKDGVPLTDERLRYLDQEASALARTTAAYEAAAEAQANLDDMRGTFQSTFSTFAQDIAKGTSALDSLASALSRVADKLIDMAVNNLFEGAFGKSGTPNSFFGNLANGNAAGGLLGGVLIPGILHNGGVAGSGSYPHRAVSASTFANAPRYHNGGVAGLKPNEVPAILERGEVVIPKGRVGQSNGGGGGVTVHINNNIDATGADVAAISRLENAIGQLSANQKRIAVEAVMQARDKNMM